MIARASDWWSGLTGRERGLLSILAALVVGVVVWFGVIAPLLGAARAAEARRAQAEQRQVTIERTLAQIAALRAAPVPRSSARPLDAVLKETASAAGIDLGRVEADPDGGLRVAIPAVTPGALFPWLARLQQQEGVAARHLAVLKTDTGALSVDATLARPNS